MSDEDFAEHARDAVDEFGRIDAARDRRGTRSRPRLATCAAARTTRPRRWLTPSRRRRRAGRHAAASCTTSRSRPRRSGDIVEMLGDAGLGRGREGDPREAVRHRRRVGEGAQRDAAPRLRRGADLPDRPLPRQGGRPEHPRRPLRQRAVRADLGPRAHRGRPDRRPGDARRSRTGPGSTRRPARSATWSSPTSSRLLGFLAMEPPAALYPDALRDEKEQVFAALPAARPGEGRARPVRGLPRRCRTSRPDSDTETFVAVEAQIDNWRWAGVPFYLRTGKRMPTGAPASSRSTSAGRRCACSRPTRPASGDNELVFELGEPGAIRSTSRPRSRGRTMDARRARMDFVYKTSFDPRLRRSRPTSG